MKWWWGWGEREPRQIKLAVGEAECHRTSPKTVQKLLKFQGDNVACNNWTNFKDVFLNDGCRHTRAVKGLNPINF